jgi:hypothetical protein
MDISAKQNIFKILTFLDSHQSEFQKKAKNSKFKKIVGIEKKQSRKKVLQNSYNHSPIQWLVACLILTKNFEHPVRI